MISNKRVTDNHLVHDGFWRVRRVGFEIEGNGASRRCEREIVEARDASAVLLFDAVRSTVLLLRQFRPAPYVAHGVRSLFEVCAGVLDPGEDAVACAVRETREELGTRIAAPRFVCRIYPSPGVCTERISLFIADYDEAARVEAGGGLAHEGEEIEPVEAPFVHALEMIESGEIIDAKTIILLQRLAMELQTV
jgi:GDP-mannose pyrophosphatase NudK